MKRFILLLITACFVSSWNLSGQIKTNKEKLLSIAVQGQVAPTNVSSTYTTTWDGKSKLAIGVGGINYDLQPGEKIFGWASSDRATMGVATVGEGSTWKDYASIGNKVTIMGGEFSGKEGVVIAKFDNYVLVHFKKDIRERLIIATPLQIKASGIGLVIEGYDDVFLHGISPEVLENLVSKASNGKLEIPVVKEIPPEIIGQGAGRGSISGSWHIQTCYPPDIEKYGLDELRFGDLVYLKDVQTDYGLGYYIGGATIGIVCSTPSDISGMGIGVTPIISCSTDKIQPNLNPEANIANYLGINIEGSKEQSGGGILKTNRDQLLTIAVQGSITPAGSRGYSTTYDGKPVQNLGMGSINYSVSVGDLAYGWANADHVEPDVSFSNANGSALGILGCIGNEAELISGPARGAKGIYVGKHGSSMIWFPREVKDKISLSDRVQVKACGVGLKIDGFEDVRVNKISPELLEKLGIEINGDQLIIPAVTKIPGHIMGSGLGMGYFVLENVDYDIQTTCPEVVEKYDLKKLRLGDIVAIEDHYDYYGRGRYEGAVTIGIVIHGWSDHAGHGPGVNPILSALPGKITVNIDPDANIAYYLGIKEKQDN